MRWAPLGNQPGTYGAARELTMKSCALMCQVVAGYAWSCRVAPSKLNFFIIMYRGFIMKAHGGWAQLWGWGSVVPIRNKGFIFVRYEFKLQPTFKKFRKQFKCFLTKHLGGAFLKRHFKMFQIFLKYSECFCYPSFSFALFNFLWKSLINNSIINIY